MSINAKSSDKETAIQAARKTIEQSLLNVFNVLGGYQSNIALVNAYKVEIIDRPDYGIEILDTYYSELLTGLNIKLKDTKYFIIFNKHSHTYDLSINFSYKSDEIIYVLTTAFINGNEGKFYYEITFKYLKTNLMSKHIINENPPTEKCIEQKINCNAPLTRLKCLVTKSYHEILNNRSEFEKENTESCLFNRVEVLNQLYKNAKETNFKLVPNKKITYINYKGNCVDTIMFTFTFNDIIVIFNINKIAFPLLGLTLLKFKREFPENLIAIMEYDGTSISVL